MKLISTYEEKKKKAIKTYEEPILFEKKKKANNNSIDASYREIKENTNFKPEVKEERVFQLPISQENSNRNSLEESSKPKALDFNKKLKASLLICLILMRNSMKNSSVNRKANAWSRWIRGILKQERELMNNELNDLNILLGEMVCRDNQRMINMRLRKNDMDSRINVLAQMMACIKVNIFQKNIKKLK